MWKSLQSGIDFYTKEFAARESSLGLWPHRHTLAHRARWPDATREKVTEIVTVKIVQSTLATCMNLQYGVYKCVGGGNESWGGSSDSQFLKEIKGLSRSNCTPCNFLV